MPARLLRHRGVQVLTDTRLGIGVADPLGIAIFCSFVHEGELRRACCYMLSLSVAGRCAWPQERWRRSQGSRTQAAMTSNLSVLASSCLAHVDSRRESSLPTSSQLLQDCDMRFRASDAAETLEFLRSPPGNRLEELKGDRSGQHSIRVNDQWRICFRWTDAGPQNVEIVDYH